MMNTFMIGDSREWSPKITLDCGQTVLGIRTMMSWTGTSKGRAWNSIRTRHVAIRFENHIGMVQFPLSFSMESKRKRNSGGQIRTACQTRRSPSPTEARVEGSNVFSVVMASGISPCSHMKDTGLLIFAGKASRFKFVIRCTAGRSALYFTYGDAGELFFGSG